MAPVDYLKVLKMDGVVLNAYIWTYNSDAVVEDRKSAGFSAAIECFGDCGIYRIIATQKGTHVLFKYLCANGTILTLQKFFYNFLCAHDPEVCLLNT